MSAHLLDLLSHTGAENGNRIYGVVVGIVTNAKDPAGLNRVKVKFPWLSAGDESDWARVATPMAGAERGIYCLPENGDEVLVMFDRGDVRFPFVIGSLWNAKDKAPADNADGENNVRLIKSRSGHVIRLNDKEGEESVQIIDAAGKNSVTIDTSSNTITVTADQDVVISAPNGAIKLHAQTIEVKSSNATTVASNASLEISAQTSMKLSGTTIDLN